LADPWDAGAFYALEPALARGWAVVAPDYLGLGAEGPPHPYLVGVPAARSALDAVRAARQLDALDLGDQTVVWGHSQGGGAALWTGVEAASYAPDVPLAGIAALAPASDVLALAGGVQESRVGQLFTTFVAQGYSAAYPDVSFDDYVPGRPTGIPTLLAQGADDSLVLVGPQRRLVERLCAARSWSTSASTPAAITFPW
jgi:acetyl esterase/lipase